MRKARGGVRFNSGRGLDHVRYAQKHRQSIKLEKKKEMDSSGMEVVQMEESYKAPKKYLVPVVFDKGNGNCSEEGRTVCVCVWWEGDSKINKNYYYYMQQQWNKTQ